MHCDAPSPPTPFLSSSGPKNLAPDPYNATRTPPESVKPVQHDHSLLRGRLEAHTRPTPCQKQEGKMGPGWMKRLEQLLLPLALALLIVAAFDFYWSGGTFTETEQIDSPGPYSSLHELPRTLLEDVMPLSLEQQFATKPSPQKLEEHVEAFLLAPDSAQSKLAALTAAVANSSTQANNTQAVQAKAIVDGIRGHGQHLPCRWDISTHAPFPPCLSA